MSRVRVLSREDRETAAAPLLTPNRTRSPPSHDRSGEGTTPYGEHACRCLPPVFAMAQLDALVWDPWLVLARHPRYTDAFDLHGFAYYYGALVTARAATALPAGEAPGRPLGPTESPQC